MRAAREQTKPFCLPLIVSAILLWSGLMPVWSQNNTQAIPPPPGWDYSRWDGGGLFDKEKEGINFLSAYIPKQGGTGRLGESWCVATMPKEFEGKVFGRGDGIRAREQMKDLYFSQPNWNSGSSGKRKQYGERTSLEMVAGSAHDGKKIDLPYGRFILSFAFDSPAGENGASRRILRTTATSLVVNGVLVGLACYAPPHRVEDIEDTLIGWISVLPPPGDAPDYFSGQNEHGEWWERILHKGLVGGIAGGVLVILMIPVFIANRRKVGGIRSMGIILLAFSFFPLSFVPYYIEFYEGKLWFISVLVAWFLALWWAKKAPNKKLQAKNRPQSG